MILSIESKLLSQYLLKQLNMFFPDDIDISYNLVQIMPIVIERMDYCFSQIHKKYYFDKGHSVFNHLNSDHYAMFLYWIANEAYKNQFINLAEKAFFLNKALHGVDAFYSIKLPDVFLFVHPIGTILGNASYSNYLVVYQNVTVGSDINGIYPQFGQANVLYSKSSVIGSCVLGNNVGVGANSFLRNSQIPDNSIAVGLYPEVKIKKNNIHNQKEFFH